MYAGIKVSGYSKKDYCMTKKERELLDDCFLCAIKTQWKGMYKHRSFYGFIGGSVKTTSHHDRYITITVKDRNHDLIGFIYLHAWEYVE